MQIDTHNRDYDGPGFKAGPLPKANNAPPGAHYSGLLECPCTDRIKKEWKKQYVTLTQGECNAKIGTAKECFEAGDALFGNERTRGMKVTNQTVKMDTKYPPACSFNGTVTFNEAKESKISCGEPTSFHLKMAPHTLDQRTAQSTFHCL